MLYLYLDQTENRLHCVSKKPIQTGHFLNQEHHIELVVPDTFVYQKPVVDSDGKQTVEDMTAEEIIASITYSEQRAAAYPSIEEQLDALYHQGYDGWKSMIDEIKTQFPKQ